LSVIAVPGFVLTARSAEKSEEESAPLEAVEAEVEKPAAEETESGLTPEEVAKIRGLLALRISLEVGKPEEGKPATTVQKVLDEIALQTGLNIFLHDVLEYAGEPLADRPAPLFYVVDIKAGVLLDLVLSPYAYGYEMGKGNTLMVVPEEGATIESRIMEEDKETLTDLLALPVSVDAKKPEGDNPAKTIEDVLDDIALQTGLNIFLHDVMPYEGESLAARPTPLFYMIDVPAGKFLHLLLRPVGFGYLAVDANTIAVLPKRGGEIITTAPPALGRRMREIGEEIPSALGAESEVPMLTRIPTLGKMFRGGGEGVGDLVPLREFVERYVNDYEQGVSCMLDFEKGRTYSAPRKLNWEEMKPFLSQDGVDIVGDVEGMGVRLAAMPIPSSYADPGLTVQELKKMGLDNVPNQEPGELWLSEGLTYAFRTREGSVGFVEVEPIREAFATRVLYMLLEYGEGVGGEGKGAATGAFVDEGFVSPRSDITSDFRAGVSPALPLGGYGPKPAGRGEREGWVPLGRVIELLVTRQTDSVDLKTGKLVERNSQQPRGNIGDVGLTLFEQYERPIVICRGGSKSAVVDTTWWDTPDVQKLREELSTKGREGTIMYEIVQEALPLTWVLVTEEGSLALFQVTGMTEEGMRVRYKLLEHGEGVGREGEKRPAVMPDSGYLVDLVSFDKGAKPGLADDLIKALQKFGYRTFPLESRSETRVFAGVFASREEAEKVKKWFMTNKVDGIGPFEDARVVQMAQAKMEVIDETSRRALFSLGDFLVNVRVGAAEKEEKYLFTEITLLMAAVSEGDSSVLAEEMEELRSEFRDRIIRILQGRDLGKIQDLETELKSMLNEMYEERKGRKDAVERVVFTKWEIR